MTLLILAFLSAINFTDIKHLLIPDTLLLALALLALLACKDYSSMILCAILLGGLGLALRHFYKSRDGLPALGLGDCKMLFVCGLWLQLAMIPAFLIVTGLCGVLTAMLWRQLGYGSRFPFAPSISIALLQSLYL